MKEKAYDRNDGTKGLELTMELGDLVIASYETYRVNDKGKYPSYSLGCKFEGKDVFVRLTSAQAKKLDNLVLTNKTLEAYEYENSYGKQIGVRVVE